LNWREKLKEILSEPPLQEEPMSLHTSFRIGGPAEFLIFPTTLEELQKVLQLARWHEVPFWILGNGTNLLVKDGGFRGIVLNVARLYPGFKFTGKNVRCGAGTSLPTLAREAMDRGLKGLEFAAGIPGSVGGAIYMNAGAHGSSLGELVQEILVVDYEGNCRTLLKDELFFTYRCSSLQKEKVIILRAVLSLTIGSRKKLLFSASQMQQERRSKQPPLPSAGSIFCNPAGKAAGYLLEKVGAKGMRVGDAQVSTEHANFIINRGDATANDVLTLMDKMKKMVKQKYEIDLKPEIKIIGENDGKHGRS
jgi:UDP-N-acetylmuramate dehydrogenase